ncbi:hypothetical protein C0995_015855 [Termitomyces sp. Mi166|nr:hypothetical protein C0995_015855 [Termitomyces sp. Mi166\
MLQHLSSLLELKASRHSLDTSVGSIRAFHQVVQLSKTKPDSKGKSMQRDLLKNKAQAISKDKGKKKEKEQELSATADEQLVILLQQLHNTEVLKEVDAEVLKKPIAQLAFTQVLNELDIMHQQ